MKEEVLVLAGGGTGGHLFPGLAVAEAFAGRRPERRVVFVGTGRPLERRAVSAAGFELRVVSARPLRGKNLKEQGLSLVSLPYALGQAALLLRELRPVAVVGLGGYAAGPVVMAAAGAGIPTAIMEQNALPGSTNRWLGRLRCVRRAYLSFGASRRFFAPEAVRVWGNPVRSVLAQVAGAPVPLDPLALLVLGGSQGAQRLNLSVPDALARLPGAAGLRVVHQTGDAMVEAGPAPLRRARPLGHRGSVHRRHGRGLSDRLVGAVSCGGDDPGRAGRGRATSALGAVSLRHRRPPDQERHGARAGRGGDQGR